MNAGEIVEKILQSTNRTNDEVSRTRIWSLLRLHYFKIARRQSWELLRRDVTVTAATGGAWLPSDLIDIDRVRDVAQGHDFFRRDSYDVEPDEGGYRYVVSQGSESSLHYGTCTVPNKSSVVTSASANNADYTGEYCRLGNELGYYKFTSGFSADSATIGTLYTGPTLANAPLIVRPSETKKIHFYDEYEQVITSGTMKVYYWAYPRQLYQADDEILLPDLMWLELAILRDWPDARERRPVNIGELRDAEAQCLAMNKTFQRRDPARDVRNKKFSLSSSMFGRR